jgi:hypothetical protein
MRAPDTHVFVSITEEHCNYLQCVEGGIDTAHSSFLHNNDLSDRSGYRQISTNPELEVQRFDFGFQYASIRDIGEQNYVRLYTFVMPFHQIRSQQLAARTGQGRQRLPTNAGHMWVPIDDERTLVFNWLHAVEEDKPLTAEYVEQAEMSFGRGADGEGRVRHRTRANDWCIDREMQRAVSFTGITGLNTQDLAAQESMGSVVDRSREHLGASDRAVIAYRQTLFDAVEAVQRGETPPGVDPSTYRNLRASDLLLDKQVSWREVADREFAARW